MTESIGAVPAPAPQSGRTIRILLVEDHAILRDGLRALLEIEPDFEIAGDVGDGLQASAAVQELQPSLVISDITLPGCSGIQLIRDLRRAHPETRVLVLTAHNTEEYIRAALNAGAHGYVLKDSGRLDLLQAIRTVVAGGQFLGAAVAAKVVSGFVHSSDAKRRSTPARLITGREQQVLTRIAMGQGNKLIARELELSVKTVEKHRSNLMRKLALRNTAALTMFAVRHGLVEANVVPDIDLSA